MRKYNHIIWDWNGTLLDDIDLCLATINTMLSRRGLATITAEIYRRVFTFPVRDYYRNVGFNFEHEPFEDLSVEFIRGYEAGASMCSLMPGARSTLSELYDQGCRHSVLSAREAQRLRVGIQEFGLESRFTAVYGLDNHHAASKLERGLALITDLNLDPTRLLMIGDTTHDAEVAAAMGIDCWLIPNGHHDLSRLASAGVPIIPDITEIPSLVNP